jgi:alkaline phosphatase D
MLMKYFLLFLLIPFISFAQVNITNSIAVGGVTSSSARFWVRTSAEAIVNIELSESPAFTNSTTGTPVFTAQQYNFAAIIDISGLQPDTKYYYRPVVNDVADTAIRYFNTFPVEGTSANFSFAFGSCQQNGQSGTSPSPPGSVYYEIIKHQPRFFLQIGDWGYPDSTDNFPLDTDIFSADYLKVQDSYLTKFDPSFPMDTLLKTTPVDYVYDDHDYMNNNASALTSSFSVPWRPNTYGDDFILEEIPAPAEARLNSIRGYKENFPGYTLQNESRGIYHKFTYGNAEFFMLDLRSQRSPNQESIVLNTSNMNWEFNPPQGHTILGRDEAPGTGESQFTWFLNSLLKSTADWKFIVSTVPFNKAQRAALDMSLTLQRFTLELPDTSLPPGTSTILAAMELADKWIAFPYDQDSVLNFISVNNIKNVIVLSGDAHTAALDDGANAGLPEIMAGGLDITNSKIITLYNMFGLSLWNKGGQGISTDDFYNAFGKITVNGKDSVQLSLIDEYGTEFASHTVLNGNVVSVQLSNNYPADFELLQNYPNPFNPTTNIKFRIGQQGLVKLIVYNALGQQITVLIDKELQAGEYSITFSTLHEKGTPLTSGIYFYQLNYNGKLTSKKMLLLK